MSHCCDANNARAGGSRALQDAACRGGCSRRAGHCCRLPEVLEGERAQRRGRRRVGAVRPCICHHGQGNAKGGNTYPFIVSLLTLSTCLSRYRGLSGSTDPMMSSAAAAAAAAAGIIFIADIASRHIYITNVPLPKGNLHSSSPPPAAATAVALQAQDCTLVENSLRKLHGRNSVNLLAHTCRRWQQQHPHRPCKGSKSKCRCKVSESLRSTIELSLTKYQLIEAQRGLHSPSLVQRPCTSRHDCSVCRWLLHLPPPFLERSVLQP